MNKVKVGLVQMSCTNNKVENLAKAIEGVKKTAADGTVRFLVQETGAYPSQSLDRHFAGIGCGRG